MTKSEHPLAAPETAKIDQQLVGDWHDKEDQDTFHFTVTDNHWMHVVVTPKPIKSAITRVISNAPENYDLFVTVIGIEHFLNVVAVETHGQGSVTKSYVFLRYKVSASHVLQMWALSQDASADAVRAGKLKGIVHQNTQGLTVGNPPHPDVDVMFQDSSTNLVSFIKSTDLTTLFSEKMSALYPGKPPGT